MCFYHVKKTKPCDLVILNSHVVGLCHTHSIVCRPSCVIYVEHSNEILSAAERRGTPVLLSASVSDNSGNSPQMAAPKRLREIDQSQASYQVF